MGMRERCTYASRYRAIRPPRCGCGACLAKWAAAAAVVMGLTAYDALVHDMTAHEHEVPFAEWFSSLKQPRTRVGCCGVADQFYARSYAPSAKPGIAFEAVVIGRDGGPDFPMDVPSDRVNWDEVNPTGRGVIFISTDDTGTYVLCFVPGTAA